MMTRSVPVRRGVLIILLIALIAVFFSRVSRLPTLEMGKDDVWSVWMTLGSLPDTLARVPYDWPPLSYVMIWVWRQFTGISPYTLRTLTALILLIAAALTYRVGVALTPGNNSLKRRAGIMAALVLPGLGYIVYISTLNRGYVVNLALFVGALLQVIHYHRRPGLLRAFFIAATLSAMFYIHLTAVFGMVMIGIYGLIVYRRPFLWIAPTVITALLCAPEAIRKVSDIAVKQTNAALYGVYVPPVDRIANHYLDYLGSQAALWGALFLIAAAFLLDLTYRRRERLAARLNELISLRANNYISPEGRSIRHGAALIVWVLMPLILFPITRGVDAFQARHLAWVMVGIALLAGWGLALLPRPGLIACVVVLIGIQFAPMPLHERYETVQRLPLIEAFTQLRDRVRYGDALLFDLTCAGCVPIDAEEWDYFARLYFPNGLRFITAEQARTDRYPRVWYVHFKDRGVPELYSAARDRRAISQEFDAQFFQFQLFELPVDPNGLVFTNGMRWHGAELLNSTGNDLVWREGDRLQVRLYWSADTVLTLDYSVAIYITRTDDPAQTPLVQSDSAPQIVTGETATSRWALGERYIEERTVTLPYPATTGDYTVYLAVYQWWDNTRFAAPGATPDLLLPIGSLYIKAW